MTVDDLIIEFRDEADDEVGGGIDGKTDQYLWSDAALIRYINDAQLEASTRARFFVESDTSLSRVKVKAGTGVALLDPSIIRVRAARVVGEQLMLCPAYRRDMQCWPGWEDEAGDAVRFIKDYTSGKLRVHPKPLTDIVLQLTIERGPSATLGSGDELEIPVRYQRKLVNWMLYRAFSRKDSAGDARDDRRAMDALKKFEADFGPALSAINDVFEAQQEDVYHIQFGND